MKLRLWPGVVAASALLAFKYVAPLVLADGVLIAVFGSIGAAVVILLWWLFFSRARWSERLGILVLMIAATFAVQFVLHPSITGGLMGRMPYVIALQMLPLALAIGAFIGQRFVPARRTLVIAAAVLIECASFAL